MLDDLVAVSARVPGARRSSRGAAGRLPAAADAPARQRRARGRRDGARHDARWPAWARRPDERGASAPRTWGRRVVDVASRAPPIAPCRSGWARRSSARWRAAGRCPSRVPTESHRALLEAAAIAVAPTVRLAVELSPAGPSPRPESSSLLGVEPADGRGARRGRSGIARAVHRAGRRRERQRQGTGGARDSPPRARDGARSFCAVNCAALTDDLCEAELFGHARGAFTGAVGERAGLFEEADGGTLFLDEVSELSARAQAKLLRAIQEGEIRRLGETQLAPRGRAPGGGHQPAAGRRGRRRRVSRRPALPARRRAHHAAAAARAARRRAAAGAAFLGARDRARGQPRAAGAGDAGRAGAL